MLWRLLGSLGRGVRSFGGGGGGGIPRPRPVAPLQPPEGDSTAQRHQRHKAGGYGNLSHLYSPWDAFTWSTLAVLTLELVKQVRWLSSVQPSRGDAGVHQLAVLSQHQQSVPTSCSTAKEEQKIFIGVDSECELKNPSSSKRSQSKEYQLLSDTGNYPFNTDLEPDSCQLRLQGNVAEEAPVNEAASQMEQVIQTSISVAFNILGLQYMQDGQHKMAFSYFKLAADQNYSKAQFNVAICYEHGRGTKKDIAKAILYYKRAAQQGHTMAQYHYAKWLLRCWPQRHSNENVKEPASLLDKTAKPGLTQNSSRKCPLGTCYENGLRIHRRHYQQVDTASYKTVQKRMKVMTEEEMAGTGLRDLLLLNKVGEDMHSWYLLPQAVRTFSSSPCLQSLDQPVFNILRSWSTGSLSDIASGSVNCKHSPVFSDGLTLKLQSLAWSPGTVIS
ncbi:death ligand signal enhancer isoform X2 [Sceloporus undulatus]|uniref:death ligand signal enhancer isoform X2 n=1 Tax=Sceloporus undulatus TaxID=8520 RepID=UPI001C4C940B|nr:death ligand signal enhancer isoform X2 [Sceloporus undulatus]